MRLMFAFLILGSLLACLLIFFVPGFGTKNIYKTPGKNFEESWHGAHYDKNSSLQHDIAQKILKEYEPKQGAKVLDIGCGSGKVTQHIGNYVGPTGFVMGIDVAPDMISYAQENVGKQNPHICFKQANVCNLGFQEEFDNAISLSCLHWVKNLEQAFKSISNSLKPGGRIVIVMGAKNNSQLVKIVKETLHSYSLPIPWHLYNKDHIVQWLDNAGIEVQEAREVILEQLFKTKKELEAWLGALPCGYELSTAEREKLLKHVISRYLEKNPIRSDGSIIVQLPELLVVGTKRKGLTKAM